MLSTVTNSPQESRHGERPRSDNYFGSLVDAPPHPLGFVGQLSRKFVPRTAERAVDTAQAPGSAIPAAFTLTGVAQPIGAPTP
jgi:hypothetical protein